MDIDTIIEQTLCGNTIIIDQIFEKSLDGGIYDINKLVKINGGGTTRTDFFKYLLNKLEPEAEKGNKYAQNYVASICVDSDKAFKYYKLSANQGYAKAQYEVGDRYAHGLGIKQDVQKAFAYYKLSADQGHVKAQFNTAICYEFGKGVKQNIQNAFVYYKLSADQGFNYAQRCVGYMYQYGIAIKRNYRGAFKYFKLCLERENINTLLCDKNIASGIIINLAKDISEQTKIIKDKNILIEHLRYYPNTGNSINSQNIEQDLYLFIGKNK